MSPEYKKSWRKIQPTRQAHSSCHLVVILNQPGRPFLGAHFPGCISGDYLAGTQNPLEGDSTPRVTQQQSCFQANHYRVQHKMGSITVQSSHSRRDQKSYYTHPSTFPLWARATATKNQQSGFRSQTRSSIPLERE